MDSTKFNTQELISEIKVQLAMLNQQVAKLERAIRWQKISHHFQHLPKQEKEDKGKMDIPPRMPFMIQELLKKQAMTPQEIAKALIMYTNADLSTILRCLKKMERKKAVVREKNQMWRLDQPLKDPFDALLPLTPSASKIKA
jgi:hypothetical protein